MNWIAFNFLRCKNDNTILIVVYAIPNRAVSKGRVYLLWVDTRRWEQGLANIKLSLNCELETNRLYGKRCHGYPGVSYRRAAGGDETRPTRKLVNPVGDGKETGDPGQRVRERGERRDVDVAVRRGGRPGRRGRRATRARGRAAKSPNLTRARHATRPAASSTGKTQRDGPKLTLLIRFNAIVRRFWCVELRAYVW